MRTINRRKKIAAVMIIAIMAVMLTVPLTVSASVTRHIKINTLSPDKWAATSHQIDSDHGYTDVYYRINIKKSGQLKFKFNNCTSCVKSVTIYDTRPDARKSENKGSHIDIFGNGSITVDKGVYYMFVSCSNGCKCKYSYTAAKSQTNYSAKKAIALKRNKNATVIFTPKTNYSRWYKINNTSKKKITCSAMYTDGTACGIELFNSRMKRLQTDNKGSDNCYITKDKLPKGTYYIRIKSYDTDDQYSYAFGNVVILKWR